MNIRNKIKTRGVIIPLSAFILLLLYYLTPLSGAIKWAEAPVFSSGSSIYRAGTALRRFWTGIISGPTLINTVREQEQEIAYLNMILARSAEVPAKQKIGEDMKALEQTLAVSILPADVILYSSASGAHTLFLNKGLADGVVPGASVVSAEGVLIGKITSVSERSSAVLLIFDDTSTVAAQLAKDADVQMVVRGKLGMGLYMELIPQDAELAVGDLVVTSPLEAETPRGLLLGSIAKVNYADGELFQRAELKPAFSVPELLQAGIIMSPL